MKGRSGKLAPERRESVIVLVGAARGSRPRARGPAALLAGAALASASLLAACSSEGENPPPLLDGDGDDDDRGGGHDEPPPVEVGSGDVVARVGLTLPASEEFLLRATIPLPRGMWVPGEQPEQPFVVVDKDGFSTRTQVEVVSRYPSLDDGADVVELIARVERPDWREPETNLLFDVAYLPTAPAEFAPSAAVSGLLGTPGGLVLSTRDVFGNRYAADLCATRRAAPQSLRWPRAGELARQSASHEVLLPQPVVPGPAGTMPRMMGAHVFLTEWAGEDFFSLDLHVHNGGSGLDPTDPADDALHEIFFDELLLELPAGWTVLNAIPDPFFGAPRDADGRCKVPIVEAMRDGTLHVVPRQSRFQRRLVVARNEVVERAREMAEERWLAFCRPVPGRTDGRVFSWWNAPTARFGTQNHRLPEIGHLGLDQLDAGYRDAYQWISGCVAQGTMPGYPVISEGLGWAHPWGVNYGGMTGGDEIALYDGFGVAAAGSRAGYRLAQLTARMYVDRQPTALIDRDGDPTRLEDWLVEGDGVVWAPMDFFLRPMLPNEDVFGYGDAPGFQTEAVEMLGRSPAYRQALEAFFPIDFQHYIRYTRSLKTLAWLGNDALSKLELDLAAAVYRLSFHEYPTNWNGATPGWGLRALESWVESSPGWGLPFGRGNAWALDAALCAFAFGDEALRDDYRDWFERVLDVLERGQSSCTGILQASNSAKYGYLRIMQSFETSIVNNFLQGLRTSVFAGKDERRAQQAADVLTASVYAQVSPMVWRAAYHGPVDWMAVGPADSSLEPYCEQPPDGQQSEGADGAYCWSDLALGYELTGDPLFLDRACEAAGTSDLYGHLLQTGLVHLSSQAPLLALMQSLSGD